MPRKNNPTLMRLVIDDPYDLQPRVIRIINDNGVLRVARNKHSWQVRTDKVGHEGWGRAAGAACHGNMSMQRLAESLTYRHTLLTRAQRTATRDKRTADVERYAKAREKLRAQIQIVAGLQKAWDCKAISTLEKVPVGNPQVGAAANPVA